MKFVCSQSELVTALAVVGRAVPSRATHPILISVLLECDATKSKLLLTGFDLTIGIKSEISASITTPGKAAVSCTLLTDIVSKLPKDSPLTIHVDNNVMTLFTTTGEYKINSKDPEDYPDLPVVDANAIQIPCATIQMILKSTLYAVATDESKQVLMGTCLSFGSKLEAAATDGHRLSIIELPHDGDGDQSSHTTTIIPGRALKELGALLKEQPDNVRFAHKNGQAIFRVGTQTLVSPLLTGTFPNYRHLVPSSFVTTVTLDRTAFSAALSRIAVMASQHNNAVKLTIEEDRVDITAEAQDVGSCAESVAAESTGDKLTIAFNVSYLLDALKSFGAEKIVLSCNMPTTPAILQPINDVGQRTALVMPIQVRA